MKILPSIVIGFALTWSAAWSPLHAQSGGGATLTIYKGHSGGVLNVNGQTTYYEGGAITGVNNLTIYNSTFAGTTNIGMLTRTGANPISLTPVYKGADPILALGDGTTLTTGSALSLASGSTLSFNGAITGNANLTFNSGATLVTNSATTVNAGVIVDAGANSYLSSTGLMKLGTGTLILSNYTAFTGGTNATVTDGSLIFGNGGTVTSGGVLNIGSGSILSAASTNLTIATATNTNGGVLNLGGATLTLGNTNTYTGTVNINGGSLTTGSLGAVLLTNGNATTGNLILNAANNFTLSGSLGLQSATKISLAAGTLTVAPTATFPLTSLPPVQDTAAGSLGTTVKFLDAALSTNGGSILFLPAMQSLASDRTTIHINDFTSPAAGDKIVLQLTFDPTTAATLGDLANLYLAWYDPADGQWKKAIDGNSDGGAGANAVQGAYDSATDFNLGTYGVDTTNDTVWAVLDHDGTFAVASGGFSSSSTTSTVSPMRFSSILTVQTVPEPSTAGLLLLGLGLLGRRQRRR